MGRTRSGQRWSLGRMRLRHRRHRRPTHARRSRSKNNTRSIRTGEKDVRLFRTSNGIYVEEKGSYYSLHAEDWDGLLRSSDLLSSVRSSMRPNTVPEPDPTTVLPPVVSQAVWAAGVTYFRSRSARIEESKDAGGGNFYDRVYTATRPELFFKATGRRVVV